VSIRVRRFGGADNRPALYVQRRGAALVVRVRGQSRGEEWAPVDLQDERYNAADLARRIFATWAPEAEAAREFEAVRV
jgi:hypothetical protein